MRDPLTPDAVAEHGYRIAEATGGGYRLITPRRMLAVVRPIASGTPGIFASESLRGTHDECIAAAERYISVDTVTE